MVDSKEHNRSHSTLIQNGEPPILQPDSQGRYHFNMGSAFAPGTKQNILKSYSVERPPAKPFADSTGGCQNPTESQKKNNAPQRKRVQLNAPKEERKQEREELPKPKPQKLPSQR